MNNAIGVLFKSPLVLTGGGITLNKSNSVGWGVKYFLVFVPFLKISNSFMDHKYWTNEGLSLVLRVT